MKNRISLSLLATIFILVGIYIYLDNRVKQSQITYSLTDNAREYTDYDVVRCGTPALEYAFVDTYIDNNFEIYFHVITWKDLFKSSEIDWDANYTGATDIRKTTFQELLVMVKEDCAQFKEPSGNLNDETLNWSHSKFEPELPKSRKKIESEQKEEADYIRGAIDEFSADQKKLLADWYGNWRKMSDAEIIKWYYAIEDEANEEFLEKFWPEGAPTLEPDPFLENFKSDGEGFTIEF